MFDVFDFHAIRFSQMYGAVQELDLEPQKGSMLARGFRGRNFFISFFGVGGWQRHLPLVRGMIPLP